MPCFYVATGALFALLGLAASVRAQAPAPPGRELRATFYQDFRGGKLPHPGLLWSGKNGNEIIEPGEQGLRIQLPAQRGRKDTVGLAVKSLVKGDLEITTRYELLRTDTPKTGNGVGVELYLMLDSPSADALALSRTRRSDGSDEYACSHNLTINGKRRYNVKHLPGVTARAGQLRITRTGREFIYSVAEEEAGAFQEIFRYDVGPGDVTLVRMGAFPGNVAEPVEVRIGDLRVRAESIVPELDGSSADAVTAATQQQAVPKGWLVVVELAAALAVSLALLLGAVWLVARRRRSSTAAAPDKPGPAELEADAPTVSFACPGCGKVIRARGKLAGKKARCPQCAQAIHVPERTPTEPGIIPE